MVNSGMESFEENVFYLAKLYVFKRKPQLYLILCDRNAEMKHTSRKGLIKCMITQNIASNRVVKMDSSPSKD